jgi:hypothetical protein
MRVLIEAVKHEHRQCSTRAPTATASSASVTYSSVRLRIGCPTFWWRASADEWSLRARAPAEKDAADDDQQKTETDGYAAVHQHHISSDLARSIARR